MAFRFASVLGLAIFFFASTASAFNITQPSDIPTQILCPIANTMFLILITVSTIMVLYAAWIYVISRGDDEEISKARRTITYAAVGIVVALLAKGFPTVVASVVGGNSGIVQC